MIDIIVKLMLCIGFAVIALRFHVLDIGGTFFAILIGLAIVFSKGISWFSLLLLFFILGALASRYKRNFKKLRLHEKSARRAMNVIANGSIPALLALLSLEYDFAVPYVSAIAVALADTFASELGVLSNKAYLITTFRKVTAGTNGAISLLGEGMALTGASIAAVGGYIALDLTVADCVLCVAFGFLGCHFDSILGATFQGRYKGTLIGQDTILTNSDVNLISVILIALLASIIAVVT